MANCKEMFCHPCEYHNQTNTATKWCTHCNEALCASCRDVHAGLKMSRNHHVIPVDDYHTIAPILNVSEFEVCRTHDKARGFFCPSHDVIECISCIQSNHGQCKNWLPLDEAAKEVKSSVAMTDLEKDFKEAFDNARGLIDVYKSQQQSIGKQKQELKDSAENIRERIIDIIKNLEEDFNRKLDIECQREIDSIEIKTQKIAMMLDEIEGLKRQLDDLNQHASDAHIFIFMRTISDKCHEKIHQLKSAIKDDKEVTINLDFDSSISSLLSDRATLGRIFITSQPIVFQWKTLRKEEQIHIPLITNKSIDTIILDHPTTILVQNRTKEHNPIWSCAILPNNEIIFIEKEKNHLLVYNNKGIFSREIFVPYKVKYITAIDESRVGLTCAEQCAIIYNIALSKLENKINVFDECYGIAYDKNKLFVVGSKNIHCHDLSTNLNSKIMIDTEHVAFISNRGNKIYCADFSKNVVYCCDQNAHIVWKFESNKMKKPLGILTDDVGNVYVASQDSNNVIIISHDGKQHRELSFKANVWQNPRSICYDQKENRLLIADEYNGNALLYNLR